MCEQFALPDEAAVAHILNIDRWNWHWPEPRYNVAPTTRVPMIIRADDALLELNGARWGLIPHWWKKDEPPSLTFNARSEEAAEKANRPLALGRKNWLFAGVPKGADASAMLFSLVETAKTNEIKPQAYLKSCSKDSPQRRPRKTYGTHAAVRGQISPSKPPQAQAAQEIGYLSLHALSQINCHHRRWGRLSGYYD